MADAAKADERWRAEARSGCCTGCRSRTKISSTPPVSGPRAARRSTGTTSRRGRADRHAPPCRRRGDRAARRTRRSLAPGRRRSTPSSAPREIPTIWPRPAAAAAAAPRWRWRAGWCRSPTAATRAARCATRRRSATSSACVRRPGGCPARATRGRPCRSPVRSADGRRRRAVSERHRRPRPAGASGALGGRRAFPRAARAGLQRRAGRLVEGTGRDSLRAGDSPRRGRHRRVFESLGCIVEEAEPDFTDVDEAFRILRYSANTAQYAPLIQQRAEWVKDDDQVRGRRKPSASRAPTSGGRWRGRRACTNRAGSSSSATTTSSCPSRRSRRSTSPRRIRRQIAGDAWSATSTGCARAGT